MMSDMEPLSLSAATAAATAWWFDLGEVTSSPVFAARGELGRIWRLDTARGSWAVKEPLVPALEADAAQDVRFQLAAHSAGISLPLPRLTRDRKVILPAALSASAFGVRVYHWSELASDQAVTAAEIGEVTARLHQLDQAGDPGDVDAWFSEPLGKPGWVALLDEARRGRAEWAPVLDRWLPELIALESAITPPQPELVRSCHRDLNIENVRRLAAGGVVVLDWENSGPAQPERELATVICDLAADLAPAAARDGYQAYLAAGGPGRLRSAADFTMAVAVQGHLLQIYSHRALNPAESAENRARSRARLAHMLRQPITLDGIADLLDVVAAS
jgi:Ser/Thr protein kinase RdoA (MazF antagonist)